VVKDAVAHHFTPLRRKGFGHKMPLVPKSTTIDRISSQSEEVLIVVIRHRNARFAWLFSRIRA
jgi:hypothetical protein